MMVVRDLAEAQSAATPEEEPWQSDPCSRSSWICSPDFKGEIPRSLISAELDTIRSRQLAVYKDASGDVLCSK
jgi:hypothetical protein